jgi:hypothetical protein
MKSHSIEWTGIENRNRRRVAVNATRINPALALGARLFLAGVPAVAILVAAAWLAASPQTIIYLQATLWATGFVFLGLALDSGKASLAASLVTAAALPALAILSANVAAELAIVAAALLAAWVAFAIFRRG